MNNSNGFAHCATALVNVAASAAFDYLADPIALGKWSLGCMQTRPTEVNGLFTGFSLFDDSQVWFGIDPHPQLLLINFLVGRRDKLKPRISMRILPAEACDLGDGQCYVSLIAWRSSTMSEERWRRLCAAHDAEIWLIKARLEGPEAMIDPSI